MLKYANSSENISFLLSSCSNLTGALTAGFLDSEWN